MQRIEQFRYHRMMSYMKSLIRIFGFTIMFFALEIGIVILIIAEIIGIFEEIDS